MGARVLTQRLKWGRSQFRKPVKVKKYETPLKRLHWTQMFKFLPYTRNYFSSRDVDREEEWPFSSLFLPFLSKNKFRPVHHFARVPCIDSVGNRRERQFLKQLLLLPSWVATASLSSPANSRYSSSTLKWLIFTQTRISSKNFRAISMLVSLIFVLEQRL